MLLVFPPGFTGICAPDEDFELAIRDFNGGVSGHTAEAFGYWTSPVDIAGSLIR
jgi:hypothetical protein